MGLADAYPAGGGRGKKIQGPLHFPGNPKLEKCRRNDRLHLNKKCMTFKQQDKFQQTFLVSEKIYEGFIELFGDKNPLHTNEAFAVEKGFKGRVMHGNILNGFLSYFIGECLPVKNVIIHSQEIKFSNAVYVNDELFFE